MVAKITFPKKVEDALNYNEQKVQKGVADLLYASGYLRKGEALSFYQKLEGLEQRNSLNERATTKTLHVSLNFSPQDRTLDTPTLVSIAREYMHGIGFAHQPYLVYCHKDAGHPHLHVVSTTIKADGSRIPTHNLGRDRSAKVRVELEAKYNLTPAKGSTAKGLIDTLQLPQKAQYGKEETRAAIARVVSYVFQQYAFASFSEYNAALSSFGVVADRGKEKSRTYRHAGLLYRMLDEKEAKVGVPIKASLLPGKPTLKALEQKFGSGEARKQKGKALLTGKLDRAIESSKTFADLVSALEKSGVFVLPRRSKEGNIYGLNYVDHQHRTVFNGSELGKTYSAAALLSSMPEQTPEKEKVQPLEKSKVPEPIAADHAQHLQQNQHAFFHQPASAIYTVLSPPQHTPDIPPPLELTKKRRRKANKNLNL